MDLGLLGVYWHKRVLTLGGYRDLLRNVLVLLRAAHRSFSDLHWVGDGRRKPLKIAEDISNLDELVYRHSWGEKREIRGERNPDGTPTWAAENSLGFDMVFNSGKSSKEGGTTVSVHAGDGGRFTPNAITVSFPAPSLSEIACDEFYQYAFLLDLFVSIIRLTNPESGLVTSQDLSTAIDRDGPYNVGWLTYFSDARCASMSNQFPTEDVGLEGTLFSLGKQLMFVTSHETVSLGRSLQTALKQIDVLR